VSNDSYTLLRTLKIDDFHYGRITIKEIHIDGSFNRAGILSIAKCLHSLLIGI
jgi:hypothetical protein